MADREHTSLTLRCTVHWTANIAASHAAASRQPIKRKLRAIHMACGRRTSKEAYAHRMFARFWRVNAAPEPASRRDTSLAMLLISACGAHGVFFQILCACFVFLPPSNMMPTSILYGQKKFDILKYCMHLILFKVRNFR